MNPAYNKTLSLLVEIIGRHHTTPRPTSQHTTSTQTYRRKPTKRPKRFDPEAEDVKKKMLGGAKPSYSRSTDPQQDPNVDTPSDKRIPPPLKNLSRHAGYAQKQNAMLQQTKREVAERKAERLRRLHQRDETFFDRLKAALINSKEKFKAGAKKLSAKIRKRKN